MQQWRLWCTVALIVMILVTGAGGGLAQDDDPIPEIESPVRVGTNVPYPPFEYLDDDENLVGFDIDVLEAVAAAAGFEVEWTMIGWQGMFPQLAEGAWDMLASGITITAERAEIVAFSDPYIDVGQRIILRTEDSEQITSSDDLAGLTVGAAMGTANAAAAQEIPDIEFMGFGDLESALTALVAGDIDAAVGDTPEVAILSLEHPAWDLALVETPLVEDVYGFAVRPDYPELVEALNAGLAAIIADGTYADIYAEWFGDLPPDAYLPPEETDAESIEEAESDAAN